ncbi:hypothetical protein P171DRAFT_447847 [Karstenula rhodostoma CBS 690.94]|uniref:Uncharacterized protein n=1 Tax=Karstenula rhodostoma CBS 690.94 TaxID=1392251 RepID=A0A9P4P7K1_9PLEO|nr:hypothetical protein P171DRAFT_447847 [Karstenula rhodostoma CBS 690.94]
MSNQSNHSPEHNAQDNHAISPERARTSSPLTPSPTDIASSDIQPSNTPEHAFRVPAQKSSGLPSHLLGTPPPSDPVVLADKYSASSLGNASYEDTVQSLSLPVYHSGTTVQDTPTPTNNGKGIILDWEYLYGLLQDVNTRFEQHQADPESTLFLLIITEIIEDYLRTWGRNTFLSYGHRDHGNDWLLWKISSTLLQSSFEYHFMMKWEVTDMKLWGADHTELNGYRLPLEEKLVWSERGVKSDREEFEDAVEEDAVEEDAVEEDAVEEDAVEDAVGVPDPDFF